MKYYKVLEVNWTIEDKSYLHLQGVSEIMFKKLGIDSGNSVAEHNYNKRNKKCVIAKDYVVDSNHIDAITKYCKINKIAYINHGKLSLNKIVDYSKLRYITELDTAK